MLLATANKFKKKKRLVSTGRAPLKDLASYGPRIIPVLQLPIDPVSYLSFWKSLPDPDPMEVLLVKPFTYTTQPPPIILSICHESRTEGLEIYRLVFNNKLKHPLYFSPSMIQLLEVGEEDI
jgi:hypothetical protein